MLAYKTHDPSHLIGSTKTKKKTIKLKIKKNQMSKDEIEKKINHKI